MSLVPKFLNRQMSIGIGCVSNNTGVGGEGARTGTDPTIKCIAMSAVKHKSTLHGRKITNSLTYLFRSSFSTNEFSGSTYKKKQTKNSLLPFENVLDFGTAGKGG